MVINQGQIHLGLRKSQEKSPLLPIVFRRFFVFKFPVRFKRFRQKVEVMATICIDFINF